MRALWSGSLSFGLVNLPVKIYAATEDRDIHLHYVHRADGGRIHFERRCEVCGQVVAYQDLDRASVEGGQTVILHQEELEALPAQKQRLIDVVEFVPSEQIDPIRFDRSYYLEPDEKSPKTYILLREVLESTARTAIVRFSLRKKTRLAALRVYGKVLLIHTLLWDDEIRRIDFPGASASVSISAKEKKLSQQLIESFSGDFEPANFTDDYRNQLRSLIDHKLSHGQTVTTDETLGGGEGEAQAEVIDIVQALQRSIETRRKGRKRGGAPATTESHPPARKRRSS